MTTQQLILAHVALKNQWNALVERINSLGGEPFLLGESADFSDEEVRTLIKLCHPDKHGGSEESTRITARLLKMRK